MADPARQLPLAKLAARNRLASPVFAVSAIVIALTIFIVDTITQLEIAVAALYTAVILLAVPIASRRTLLAIAGTCATLTLASNILTPGEATNSGLINTAISILAIAATTYLVLRIQEAEGAAHEARAQLAQISRITALGELTASIAHEVNQPVAATVMNGNACLRWLAADPPNLEETRKTLERIVSDATRAGRIIARIREMAKRKPAEHRPVNVNEVIEEIVTLIASELNEQGVTLRIDLMGGDAAMAIGDRVALGQVVLNLTMNAVEAMEKVPPNERQLAIVSMPAEGEAIAVEVRDNGAGFDTGEMARIFDAFYTTKGAGMGLGLTIARSIVESFGGAITARANHPRGAIFRFTLPSAKPA